MNALNSGKLYSTQVYRYLTKDGKGLFSFSYHYENGHYVVAIHQHPDYNGRIEYSSVAHWLPCEFSPINKKICFKEGFEPSTLEQAKKNSMQYAELTMIYIQTGITIDEQLIRRN